MGQILSRLHFTFEQAGEGKLLVHVPSRRGDITRDVDLIEEVARLFGYDNIPTTLMTGVTTPGSLIQRAIHPPDYPEYFNAKRIE